MSSLSVTRSYDDGEVLVRADLDAFLDDIETFVNVTKFNDDNLQNSGITGSTKLVNQSVTEAKLAGNSVSTVKIVDASITAAKMTTDSVVTTSIVDSNVTTAKIADLAVTTGKIADNAITAAKMANATITSTQISASAAITPGQLHTVSAGTDLTVASFSSTSTSFTTVGSFSTAASPTAGRPVLIIATPTGADGFLGLSVNTSTSVHTAIFQIVRTSDNKVVNEVYFGLTGPGTAATYLFPISHLNCVDISDGTTGYFLQLRNNLTVSDVVSITKLNLSAVVM